MSSQKKNYFDLTELKNNVDAISIFQDGHFNCSLVNIGTGEVFNGFILAKSPKGNKFTVCDVDFHKSETDGKFQPRLVFRRTKKDFQDVVARAGSEDVIISFQHGMDGYREFWKMIFFLYKFKEIIDVGDFEGQYRILTSEELSKYLNGKDAYDQIVEVAGELNSDISEILRSGTTLKLLKEYKKKLGEFIEDNASEKDVQNWIDEAGHKYRQQRCMIFGIEYIDFKREGSVSSKKFDVLTRVGSKHIEHVLIELKSPSDDIFEKTSKSTTNEKTFEYRIHPELSRAIPQILEYKSTLESKFEGDPELEKLGIKGKPEISKCIIVIGRHQDDPRWKVNRKNLVKSLNSSLEIWTYTELLDKLDATIENLESNKEVENYK